MGLDNDLEMRNGSRENYGQFNEAFVNDDGKSRKPVQPFFEREIQSVESITEAEQGQQRAAWGSPIEFVMSCISVSVGLGNIWRFPFTAYENGGGAFLIPYLIVLLFIGKPLYFLEMALGQFSSYGSVKVWEVAPIVKGIGYGQAFATFCVVTYYTSLMAVVSFYFLASFQSPLPWAYCDPAWATDSCQATDKTLRPNRTDILGFNCSSVADNVTCLETLQGGANRSLESSTEQYFRRNVLQQSANIDDGIGVPEWRLSLCLLFAWIAVFLILFKGLSSSGKAAYFTAIFPYFVLLILLIRGVTLEGAYDGIMFYITPQWDKILEPKVWYAAVTQCFFSLSVGFGPIIMFSSYNSFKQPIYRDAIIISFMDTFTSLFAGIAIFAILGNLAHELGEDITKVVKGGAGLAFVSYPDAISKMAFVPQIFAVLFFLMLFVLGIGSVTALTSVIITIIHDDFPNVDRWKITAFSCTFGFLFGLVYVTPGGQYILDLVDYFGGGFIIFVLTIIETVAISWIYGYKNLIRDIHFMLGKKLSYYWVFEWGFFIPIALVAIFIYSVLQYEPLKINGSYIPDSATAAGWVLTAIAVLQVPIWAAVAMYKQSDDPFVAFDDSEATEKGTVPRFFNKLSRGCSLLFDRMKKASKPTNEWGPKNPEMRAEWIRFCQDCESVESEEPNFVIGLLYTVLRRRSKKPHVVNSSSIIVRTDM